jgi:hypothetical protein
MAARGFVSINVRLALGVALVILAALAMPRSLPVQAAPNATFQSVGVPVGYGQIQPTGLKLAAGITASDTTISFTDNNLATTNDHRYVKAGMPIRIDNEQMLITQLNDNLPDPMGLSEAPPYADSAVVLRAQGGTLAASHSAGVDVKGHHVRVPIKALNVAHQEAGTLAASLGTATTQDSGARLLDATNTTQTALNVTDATRLIAGSVVTIGTEQMAVGIVIDSSGDGYSGITELALGSDPATLQKTPEHLAIPGTCSDGIDNDGDTQVDAADSGCSTTNSDGDAFANVVETALGSNPNSAASTPEHSAIPGTCTDGIDNDGDGLIDGADTGCDAIDADADGFNGAVERALGSNPGDVNSKPESLLVGGSCADGIDNDGDGNIDAKDSGCSLPNTDNDNFGNTLETQFGANPSSAASTPEHGAFAWTCSDGLDNDGDGLTDGADPGCDHIDADSDGFIGAAERALGSNPASAASTPESIALAGKCSDGIDNDGDGLTDAADPGCAAADTDGDTYPDVVETALGSSPSSAASKPEHAVFPATCTDGLNNDGDGATDGADTGCDAIDADGDGWAGAMERALGSDPANGAKTPESPRAGNSCADGIDNDGDGTIDALDSSCGVTNSDSDTWADAIESALGSSTTITSRTPEHAAIPATCEDGIDNDGDGLIDADDSGCSSLDVDADSIQVIRAFNGTTAASHAFNAVINENVVDVPVSNAAIIGVNSILQIDNERMNVKALRFNPDVIEVVRAVNGTTAASHSNGAAITDIDGLGGFDLQFEMDRTYGDVITATNGNFLERCTTDTNGDGQVCNLGDEGRDADCQYDLGVFENSTATLSSSIGTSDTVINISDQSVLRVGGAVRIDSEDMVVRSLKEGTPDQMTVFRGASPASHSAGAAVFAQNVHVGGFRFRCITTSIYPFNYGPTGEGTLGFVWVMPMQRTPVTPLPLEDLHDESLVDISGGSISYTLNEGRMTIAKCPDPNNSGAITQADWLEIARASLGIITPDVNKHDLNGNNVVGTEDRLIVARILFLYSVSVANCGVLP